MAAEHYPLPLVHQYLFRGCRVSIMLQVKIRLFFENQGNRFKKLKISKKKGKFFKKLKISKKLQISKKRKIFLKIENFEIIANFEKIENFEKK